MTKEQEQETIKYLEFLQKEYLEDAKRKKENGEITGYGTMEDIDKLRALHIGFALDMLKEKDKEIDCLKNHVHYKVCPNCKKEFRTKRSDAKHCKECAKTVNNKDWYKSLTDEQKTKRREQSKMSMRRLRERRKNER